MHEEGGESARILLTVEIPASRERVWWALTDPEAIVAWWREGVSLDARAGGAFVERWRDASGREVVTSGRVLGAEPPSELDLSWADDDWEAETRVHVRLEDVDGRTRVTLVHDGWDAFAPRERERLMREHAAGWSAHLERLAAHAEGTAA